MGERTHFKSAIFEQDVAEQILQLIAEGQPLTKICKTEGMPRYRTVLNWLTNGNNPEFERAYALCREHQADTLTDEIMEDAERAEQTLKGDRSDNARVQAVRLRIDTKKWVASKMKPNKYGDRLGLTNGSGGPVEVAIVNYATEQKDNDPA